VQKPIRYYISKNGDEPTLRSVPVTLDRVPKEERAEPSSGAVGETVAARGNEAPARGVSRFVKSAIKKRTPGT
jgi:hypothetical protein